MTIINKTNLKYGDEIWEHAEAGTQVIDAKMHIENYCQWRINNNKIILRDSLSQARLWKKEGHKLSQRLRKCVRKKQALCDPISIATSSQTKWNVGQLPQHILKSNISKAKLSWMSNKRKNNNFLWEFSSFFVILISLVLYYIEMLRKSKKMKTVFISYRQYVTWLLPGFLASTATQSLKGRKIGNKHDWERRRD